MVFIRSDVWHHVWSGEHGSSVDCLPDWNTADGGLQAGDSSAGYAIYGADGGESDSGVRDYRLRLQFDCAAAGTCCGDRSADRVGDRACHGTHEPTDAI